LVGLARGSRAEEVIARFKVTIRKEFGNNRCRHVAHLLGTHNIRVGFRDHAAQITEICTIHEKADRQDAEKGHKAGKLPPTSARHPSTPISPILKELRRLQFESERADGTVHNLFRDHADMIRKGVHLCH
jgi:hypothetical protein